MATDTIDGSDLPDLPRYNEQALIGDKRNDENVIVSQLQLAFLLAHNALVDRVRKVEGINKQGSEPNPPDLRSRSKDPALALSAH